MNLFNLFKYINSNLIIRISENKGFGYAATDLAALRYRVNELNCNRIIYVTDIG